PSVVLRTSAALRTSSGNDPSRLASSGIAEIRATATKGIATTTRTRGIATTTRIRKSATITGTGALVTTATGVTKGIATATAGDRAESTGVDRALGSRIHSRGEIR